MPVHHDPDFPPALAIVVAGMLAPALLAAVARDLISMYLSVPAFVLGSVVAFGVVAWLLIERLDLDRTTFLLVSIVMPWPVLIAGFFAVMLLNTGQQIPTGLVADVFRYLFGDLGSFFGYGAAFSFAGVAVSRLSVRLRERAERDARGPNGWVLPATIGLLVVLGGGLLLGVNLAAAAGVTVSMVEPGVDTSDHPTLNVTVDGPPAELRVTVLAPDGTSVTKRRRRADTQSAPTTVAFRVRTDDTLPPDILPLRAGTYQVRVTTLSGVAVDTASFTADAGRSVTASATATASGEVSWDDPPAEVVGSADHDVLVGVAVENEGSFYTRVSVALETPDNRYFTVRDLPLAPGERIGLVFSLPDETVDAIRADRDGRVTVELHNDGRFDDPITTLTVELPSP